jgi:hypothetical protein
MFRAVLPSIASSAGWKLRWPIADASYSPYAANPADATDSAPIASSG